MGNPERHGHPRRSDSYLPVDLHDDGVLYMVNQVLFHPRGFALAMSKAGEFFLMGDGSERFRFAEGTHRVGGREVDETADNDEKWSAFNALLDRARGVGEREGEGS